MSKTKAGVPPRTAGDSAAAKRSRSKVFDGEFVNTGARNLVRQRGPASIPATTSHVADDTLFATAPGTVKYADRHNRRLVSVIDKASPPSTPMPVVFVDRVWTSCRRKRWCRGCAFVRAKGKPKGKPIGGNGGPGGSVYLRADPSVATLLRYQRNPHYAAGHGTHGQGDVRHGKTGEALYLPVPLGTVVIDDEGTMVADLVAEGQEIEVVKGGRGGRGNAAFVNPSNRAPSVAEQGEYGRSEWLTLELKLLADAALIGFPNAGKSTFISKVSAAKPKIADYPFTTLVPNLGVVSFDGREFVLADIPA